MRTIKKVSYELVEVEFIPPFEEMKAGILYYSPTYKTVNHLCPCGCGEQTPIHIKQGEFTIEINAGKATITPSLFRRMGCKSHYIITNGVANIV